MEADYTSHESDVLFWYEHDNENLIKVREGLVSTCAL